MIKENDDSLSIKAHELLMSISDNGVIHKFQSEALNGWKLHSDVEGKLDKDSDDEYYFRISVGVGKANMAIEKLRERLIPMGLFPYFTSMEWNGPRKFEITVIKTNRQYDAISYSLKNNELIDVEAVIERLAKWEYAFGLSVFGVGNNWLTVRLHKLPEDVIKFVENEVLAINPTLIDDENHSYLGNGNREKIIWSIASFIGYHRICTLKW